jgi:hypothetical protein
VAALAPLVLLVVAHWPVLPGLTTGDYAQYILHAQAIADGRPYTETGYLFHPGARLIGPVAYPPGLSLTLAPILATGADPPTALRAVVALSIGLMVVLTLVYLRDRDEAWAAALAAAMAGVAVETSGGTLAMGSDAGFAALMWATILVIDRPGTPSTGRLAAIAALGAAAMAYRLPGIVLIPALALHAFLRPAVERRRLLVVPAVWLVLGIVALVLLEPLRTNLDGQIADVLRAAGRLLRRVHRYPQIAATAVLHPFGRPLLNDGYHVLAGALIAIGGVRLTRRYWRSMLFVCALAYTAVIVATPFASARLFWPVYPVLALCLVHGGYWVATRVGFRAPAARNVTVAFIGAVIVAGTVREARRSPPPSLLGNPDMAAVITWIRDHPERPTMRALFYNPRVLTLETGVPAMGVPALPPEEILREAASYRVTYLVVATTPVGDTRETQSELLTFLRGDGGTTTRVFANTSYEIYQLPLDP